MINLDLNRAVVLRFCESLSRRDFAGMAELVTPDATWWVVGRPDYASYGGCRAVADVFNILEAFIGTLDEFEFTVNGVIAEGERVAIEATSLGRSGAAHYNNVYMMRYEIREGRIHSVREFFDAYELTAFLKQLGVEDSDVSIMQTAPHNV